MGFLSFMVGYGSLPGKERKSKTMAEKIYLHPLVERIWHGIHALSILILILSGVQIHWPESINIFGNFQKAISVHNFFGLVVLGDFFLWFIYNLVSRRITHYLPNKRDIPWGLVAQAKFYGYGIFKHEPHPVKKTELTKLNPLQRLTYIYLKVIVLPLQIITGFVYLYYNDWNKLDFLTNRLDIPALMHTIGAFILVIFLVTHIYLTTTGHTPLSNIKSMITGWEDIED